MLQNTLLATSLTASLCFAQTHTRTPMIRGELATFSAQGTPAGALVLIAMTGGGLGRGLCFPAPISICMDVRNPLLFFPPLLADGSGRADASFRVPLQAPLVAIASQALVASVQNSNLVVGKTNALEESIRTLAAYDDLFGGSTLDTSWRIHNPHLVSIRVGNGELHLRPTQAGPNATWFANGEGPFLYKLVTGDFDVRARVRSYDPATNAAPPLSFNMGGITIRDPRAPSGRHNWLHVAVGAGDSRRPIAVEDKNTRDSTSSLRLTPLTAPRAWIRAVRRGAMISFYFREPNDTSWRALRSFPRPDLPATLQVGLSVFSWTAPVRVQSSFDEIRYARPQ